MNWLGEKIEALIGVVVDTLIAAFDAVFTFFADIIEAAWNFLKSALETTWDWFVGIVEAVWGWAGDVIDDLWVAFVDYTLKFFGMAKDWIIEWAGGFGEWLDLQAQGLGLQVSIDDIKTNFTTLADLYADVAWLLPLNGVAAVIATTIVTIALLRAIRWVISFLWITG